MLIVCKESNYVLFLYFLPIFMAFWVVIGPNNHDSVYITTLRLLSCYGFFVYVLVYSNIQSKFQPNQQSRDKQAEKTLLLLIP
ncbi:hypothetical protein PHAVU_005G052700, partial [Phaseolus vulgaris]|uniref:Uncharacterized protein n=1 Tax=Phaseolus vulgaris TaxID=3885 RepID=V7BXD4_PHAVU|nr:hypothetical protein PHAVU_005G052700g [Phaseolus vulgaris]ESW21226.1 hypothetical protein PHAVU_005G052700g [Phaseolus vulgaris]